MPAVMWGEDGLRCTVTTPHSNSYCLLPTAYYLLSATNCLTPTTYYLPPTYATYHLHLPPATCHLPPTTYYPPPTTHHPPPATHHPPPTTHPPTPRDQAWIACEKNEALAANLLFDGMGDD